MKIPNPVIDQEQFSIGIELSSLLDISKQVQDKKGQAQNDAKSLPSSNLELSCFLHSLSDFSSVMLQTQ